MAVVPLFCVFVRLPQTEDPALDAWLASIGNMHVLYSISPTQSQISCSDEMTLRCGGQVRAWPQVWQQVVFLNSFR